MPKPQSGSCPSSLFYCEVTALALLAPRFVSVTYGADGTTQAGTLLMVLNLKRETDLIPAAHLTCVGATREGVDDLARYYRNAAVNHIVAIRGDPPAHAADDSSRRDRCLVAGISAPINPGIMPASNYEQIVRLSAV
ncbi:methylenetetrahydrofolate reductase [Gluconobacter wancherniae]|uniref:methylenetetrahydrofolate reductase n=1 Tax=Gluconobacter wancherniae TaxID=1307955 RepID=UPI001B8AE05D|nr:methylenetetrahydrofolate reductase [Gluconobacter wancherniae]MBS1063876.1 methylenetetrahydrofolate reductase [Gluconobacter wancherniae]